MKFFLVAEKRMKIVQAETESEALNRHRDPKFSHEWRASAMCRFPAPVEAKDQIEAQKKFQEGPAAGLFW